MALGAVALAACGVVLILTPRPRADAPPAPPRPARPNVVLISIDTVRPDHLGCYGYERPTSPNLDALAARGVLFKNAYTQAPWTLPSHMSLFTSMLPSHNRVEDLNERLADDIPTLAELLRKTGYNTAALVNNGQMRAHWGFARGFDLWREFQVDTPAGSCENITRQALEWLAAAPREPYFLFLHYYDPHDPYDPPPKYRAQFGSTLSGSDAHSVVWTHRMPGKDLRNPQLMREIIGSYDGEIAWMDFELGKLLAAVPSDALIVVFSDHGEAFEEHGWTTHGAALYQEEVKVALILSRTRAEASPRVVEEPVMLLDVAPTMLRLCGLEPPAHHEGRDLTPLLRGGALPERPILAETKRHLEGRVLKMCLLGPDKLIYSLLDGALELYRLPDEHTERARTDPECAGKLFGMVREWVAEEDYWVLYASGEGAREASLVVPEGKFTVFIPVGFDMERDQIRPALDGGVLRVRVHPRGEVKALYFEVTPREAEVTCSLGTEGEAPARAERDPVIEEPFAPERDGLHLIHYRSESSGGRSALGVELDKKTIEQLRSLGYMQ